MSAETADKVRLPRRVERVVRQRAFTLAERVKDEKFRAWFEQLRELVAKDELELDQVNAWQPEELKGERLGRRAAPDDGHSGSRARVTESPPGAR